ncbi:hypothetical protein [Polaromonas sp.]|uniref:hypothetical protein n=1 Tax=Polaromonas sp. TaxID=1869339 RepID=UPI001D4F49E0|nr:hypothetical protein [Polaromonas sp.]MBT9475126.1 hypothetical protein [Polaromonas sp.]
MAFLRQCLQELRARQGDQNARFLNDPDKPDQRNCFANGSQLHLSLSGKNRFSNGKIKENINTFTNSV